MDLSSHSFEIPNDDYMLLSEILIGCSSVEITVSCLVDTR